MASKEEIQKQNIEESNKLLAEQLNLVSKIQDKMAFLIKTSSNKLTQDKLALNLTKDAVSLTKSLASEYDSVKKVEKDIAKNKKLENDIARTQLNLEKNIGDIGKQRIQFIKNQESGLNKSKEILEDLRKQETLGVIGAKAKADALGQQIYAREKGLATQIQNLSVEEKEHMLLSDTSKILKENSKYLAEQLRRQENLAKSQSLFVSMLEGANNLLNKMGMGTLAKKLGLEAAVQKAKDLTYELTDGGKKSLSVFGKLRVGVAAFGAALKSALGPLSLIGLATSLFAKFKEQGREALEYMKEVNTETTNLTRELGVSSKIGEKVAGSARSIGAAMGMTREQATNSAKAIYGQLSGTEQLGDATMKTFMKLNVHGNVSTEVLGKMYTLSKLTGKEAGTVANEIANQAQESIKSLKLNVSMKSIMEGVSKVSNRVALSFKGSGTALTSAVAQSKKLGLEMSKIEEIADKLLNIEDSIAAEMEAELLTGKDLNLEKAREAALNNDNKALMEALAEQNITAADFSKMNRIQQDALAKALGLSSSEMADMLVTQKQNEATNQKLLDTQNKGVAAMTSQASLAETITNQENARKEAMGPIGEMFFKFQTIMNNIATTLQPIMNALFTELGKIVGPIFEGVAKWLTDSDNIKIVTEGIKNTFSFIKELVTPIFNLLTELANITIPVIKGLWDAISPTIMSIKDTILNIVTSITSLIEKLRTGNGEFTDMEKTVGIIGAGIGGFLISMKGIKLAQEGWNKAMGVYQGIKVFIEGLNKKEEISLGRRIALGIREAAAQALKAIAQVTGMSAATLGVAAGVALAAGAAAALYFSNQESKINKGDDIFSEGGYGKRTLLGPEGAIQLNNNDDVIAGTDLFNKNKKGGGGDNNAVVAELQRVSALLQQILGKEGVVMIDGNKVGTTLALSNYQQQ